MSNLMEALCKAQGNMTLASKDATNPHFKSAYSTYAAMHAAVVPHLNAEGIYCYATIVDKAVVTTFAMAGADISVRVPLVVDKNDMQGLGSAITYARRYGLQLLSGIAVADNDDDGQQAVAAPPKLTEAEKMGPIIERLQTITTTAQLEKAAAYIETLGFDPVNMEQLREAAYDVETKIMKLGEQTDE